MSKKITNITAVEILDSRKNPTLRVSTFADNYKGIFEVPSGASTGKYEACELRDENNSKSGVNKAINQIETAIKPALIGLEIDNQAQIDETMLKLDGTPQKTNLGGNSMIGVSIAASKAAAYSKEIEIYQYLRELANIKKSKEKPFLYFNLINGGKHTNTDLAFQEYHIVPQTENLEESTNICNEVEKKLSEIILKEFGQNFQKGDEGGIALPVSDVIKPLLLLKEAVDSLNYTDKVMFAMDVAASSFYSKKEDHYYFMNKSWSRDEMLELYEKIISDFPIISIEDPLDEEDFEGFALIQKNMPEIKIIGDDLTVTNKERLKKAIKSKSIKGIIIKPNQIGTLTETIETIRLARENNIDCIVSHRSGETMDTFIGDLTYAFGCYGIKAGALGPKERNVKYERLINITK